ncbi:DUF2860 family protein [Vibrio sp. FNV 38]|nr:DUF2860 family protein [Vibrio sp. FNV 38]
MNRYVKVFVFTATMSGSVVAATLNPMPTTDGFSGYVGGGAAVFEVKSNFLGGNRFVQLDNENASNLNASPGSETTISPEIKFDFRYTFDNMNTQLFLGTPLVDLARLDFSQQFGVRHSFHSLGTFSSSYVFSSVPTEVWEDPFDTDQERSRTDRNSNGFKLAWDDIFDMPVGISYTYRKIDIDNEQSGSALVNNAVLTPEESALLNREGDVHRVEIISLFDLDNGAKIAPQINFIRFDTKGASAAHKTYQAQVSYLKPDPSYVWAVTGFLSHREYDKPNPIFGRKPDSNGFGISGSLLLHKPFQTPNINLLFGLAWVQEDSDVSFYDNDIMAASASVLYNF